MKRKPKPRPTPAATPTPAILAPPAPAVAVAAVPAVVPTIGLWRDAFSDDRGRLDAGEMMVPLAVLGILAIAAYAVIINHQPFNAQDVGIGCAALVTALLASRWGNAKMQTAMPPPSTVTTVQSTQVTTP